MSLIEFLILWCTFWWGVTLSIAVYFVTLNKMRFGINIILNIIIAPIALPPFLLYSFYKRYRQ